MHYNRVCGVFQQCRLAFRPNEASNNTRTKVNTDTVFAGNTVQKLSYTGTRETNFITVEFGVILIRTGRRDATIFSFRQSNLLLLLFFYRKND